MYFRADDIAPLECLDAVYTRQVFALHFHEEYVVNTLTGGAIATVTTAVRMWPAGALVLINPARRTPARRRMRRAGRIGGMYPAASLLQRLACEMAGRAVTPYFRETVIVDPALSRELVGLHRLLREVADHDARIGLIYGVWPGLCAGI